jgi:hypothetical protein
VGPQGFRTQADPIAPSWPHARADHTCCMACKQLALRRGRCPVSPSEALARRFVTLNAASSACVCTVATYTFAMLPQQLHKHQLSGICSTCVASHITIPPQTHIDSTPCRGLHLDKVALLELPHAQAYFMCLPVLPWPGEQILKAHRRANSPRLAKLTNAGKTSLQHPSEE